MSEQAIPSAAQTYLDRALGGSRPPRAARLRMHGSIRLSGAWRAFRATEWLDPLEGFEWRARVRVGPAWITGYDRLRGGRGEMRWRLFGLVPVVRARGADVTRSAAGRAAAESVLMPAALLDPAVRWSEAEDGSPRAEWSVAGEAVAVDLDLTTDGSLRRARMQRWGNPDDAGWRRLPFGAIVDDEASFGGLTLPSRLRVGWWPDEPRFEDDGDFFHAVIDDVEAVVPGAEPG